MVIEKSLYEEHYLQLTAASFRPWFYLHSTCQKKKLKIKNMPNKATMKSL
jgi:hypothetical protein